MYISLSLPLSLPLSCICVHINKYNIYIYFIYIFFFQRVYLSEKHIYEQVTGIVERCYAYVKRRCQAWQRRQEDGPLSRQYIARWQRIHSIPDMKDPSRRVAVDLEIVKGWLENSSEWLNDF